jgi:hypothetical protein
VIESIFKSKKLTMFRLNDFIRYNDTAPHQLGRLSPTPGNIPTLEERHPSFFDPESGEPVDLTKLTSMIERSAYHNDILDKFLGDIDKTLDMIRTLMDGGHNIFENAPQPISFQEALAIVRIELIEDHSIRGIFKYRVVGTEFPHEVKVSDTGKLMCGGEVLPGSYLGLSMYLRMLRRQYPEDFPQDSSVKASDLVEEARDKSFTFPVWSVNKDSRFLSRLLRLLFVDEGKYIFGKKKGLVSANHTIENLDDLKPLLESLKGKK